jgi:hypothetical protein
MPTKPALLKYAVQAVVKVPGYRGKRFRGITEAHTADDAQRITRLTLYNSLHRAIRNMEMRHIVVDDITLASDFYIREQAHQQNLKI